jgi:hypothetical protein
MRVTPQHIHRLADKKGIVWDSGKPGSARFIALCKRVTGKAHLDDMTQIELLRVSAAIRKA